MKKNNVLKNISNIILILSFIYLIIQIYGLLFNLKFWLKYNDTIEILLGIFREISEILYIPLWGIALSFALIFCDYWTRERND
jgi:hypothetical protein